MIGRDSLFLRPSVRLTAAQWRSAIRPAASRTCRSGRCHNPDKTRQLTALRSSQYERNASHRTSRRTVHSIALCVWRVTCVCVCVFARWSTCRWSGQRRSAEIALKMRFKQLSHMNRLISLLFHATVYFSAASIHPLRAPQVSTTQGC